MKKRGVHKENAKEQISTTYQFIETNRYEGIPASYLPGAPAALIHSWGGFLIHSRAMGLGGQRGGEGLLTTPYG